MKKLSKFAFIVLIICNISCKTKKENHNIFLQYLKETFNENDIVNKKTFVVIPCLGCSGCDQSVYYIFTNHFLNSKNITLIICDPVQKGLLPPTLEAKNIKYDSLSKMADYDFGYGYPACITVENNNVTDKLILSLTNIDLMEDYLKNLD